MNLYERIPKQWVAYLNLEKEYFKDIEESIREDSINPSEENIFKTFEIDPDRVKVVIVGQDPYPNSEDAMGLAFSISPGRIKIPGSLRNIKKELYSDIGIPINNSGDLSKWLDQGVMLLNRILTTKSGESMAHRNIGWEDFTERVIKSLSERNVVFILWGKNAEYLRDFIPPEKTIVGTHPSPLSASRGFFGSKPFSVCNNKLASMGVSSIDWKI